jgi:hypothetical protein
MQPHAGISHDGGRERRRVLVLTTIVLLVPLAWFAYIGFFSRIMADDYCGAANLQKLGFVGAQTYSFQHWSGRFSAIFLATLIAVPGVEMYRVVPLLVILGLVGGSLFFFSGLLGLARISSERWHARVLAVAATLLLLGGPSNVYLYTSLYWMGSSTIYLLPLVGLLMLLGILIRTPKSRGTPRVAMLGIVGFATAGFLIGGFNEILSCGMASGFVLLLVADRFLGERAGLRAMSPRVGAALVGTLLALVVGAMSPGNALRKAEYPPPADPLTLLATSTRDAGHFIKVVLHDEPVLLSGILLLSVGLGVQIGSPIRPAPSGRSLVKAVAGAATAAGIVLVSLMLPFEYALRAYPPARALVPAQFLLSFGVVSGGCLTGIWLAGSRLQRPSTGRILNSVAVCLLLAGAATSAAVPIRGTFSLRRDAQEFAAAWDRRDARIRAAVAAGATSIQVPSLTSMGTLEEIKYNPDDWVNMCVAAYYGLDEVIAK